MKILALHNTNHFALELFRWLEEEGNELVMISEPLEYDKCKCDEYDLVISYTYDYKISEKILELYKNKAINLHISYLPWNKGFSPNVWSFLENTPKGVTIHKISAGIDEGDIICQKEVFFGNDVTLKSSYDKLNVEIIELFKQNWKNIRDGLYTAKSQIGEGSKHTKKDLDKLKEIIQFDWGDKVSEVIDKYRRYVKS